MELKILLILGNGYDLNLGLPTSYKSFLESLNENPEPWEGNALIAFIKAKELEEPNWVDIEVLIGEYYKEKLDKSNVVEIKKMKDDYAQLCKLLGQYLDENGKYKLVGGEIAQKANIFYDRIRTLPDKLELDSGEVINALYKDKGKIDVATVSLNYTTSFNVIFPNKKKVGIDNRELIVNPALSLHGSLKKMVFGVDSVAQLGETKFSEDQELLDLQTYLIKEKCSKEILRQGDERQFRNLLETANITVLYGVSLGETDHRIWRQLKNWLTEKRESLLIVHRFGIDFHDKFKDDNKVDSLFGKENKDRILKTGEKIF